MGDVFRALAAGPAENPTHRAAELREEVEQGERAAVAARLYLMRSGLNFVGNGAGRDLLKGPRRTSSFLRRASSGNVWCARSRRA
jgi:hypothetical protein